MFYAKPEQRANAENFENEDLHTCRIVVRNGDGTQRVVVGVPRIDGYTDYSFEFDWQIGASLGYARRPRTW